MKNYLMILIAFVNLPGHQPNSSRNINGTVYSSDNKQPLNGVLVHQLNTNNNNYTNQLGHYQLAISGSKAKLIFSLPGYKPDTLACGKSNTLNVYLKKAIVYRADSVNYRVASRDGSPNRTIDDVLKKMPGMAVAQNSYGKNKASLNEVTVARVNGKDFAGGSAQQAVRNLPADLIEKVQIVDGYGEQATKSGFTFPAPVNTESYGTINENPFLNPQETPLSTFATDVDAASYANVRRFINSGQLPPKDAVRIEEMINYFKYNLPKPDRGEPVAIQTEFATAPWNPQHQLVKIGLKAKEVENSKLPPSNLVFLLDVSGSMDEPAKLPLVKVAMKMLVDQLRPIDHVAIVTYAGYSVVALEPTPADQKQKIKDAIESLGAGGGTAGAAGIMTAYKIAQEKFIQGGNNRIIMATDGDFNVGPSSDKDMEQIIEGESNSKVSLSILGFGMGNYKDSKMELLADKGHGNYAYIDNINEATKSMVREFGSTMFTVAKDVKLQVEFNPAKVQAYRLLGYEDRLMAKEDFNNDNKMGGDMGVGHTVTALYEIIPTGVKDDSFMGSVDPLKYQKPVKTGKINKSSEVMTVKFRYKQPDADISKMESVTVSGDAIALAKASADFKFAAGVAEFGMLLRDSKYKQQASYDQVISLAKSGKGNDDDGYRAEFIRLAESTKNLVKTNEITAVK